MSCFQFIQTLQPLSFSCQLRSRVHRDTRASTAAMLFCTTVLGRGSCRENVYSGGLGGLHCPCPTCDTSTSLVTLKGRELFLTEVVRKKTSPQLFSLLPGSRQAIVTGRTVPGVRSTGKVRDLPLHEFPGGLQECQRKITPQSPATRSPWNLRLNRGKPLHRCRLQNKRFLRVSVVPFKSG